MIWPSHITYYQHAYRYVKWRMFSFLRSYPIIHTRGFRTNDLDELLPPGLSSLWAIFLLLSFPIRMYGEPKNSSVTGFVNPIIPIQWLTLGPVFSDVRGIWFVLAVMNIMMATTIMVDTAEQRLVSCSFIFFCILDIRPLLKCFLATGGSMTKNVKKI